MLHVPFTDAWIDGSSFNTLLSVVAVDLQQVNHIGVTLLIFANLALVLYKVKNERKKK